MKCAEAYRYICDNLDQNIRSARCRTIREHLDCCPVCRAILDSLKKTVQLYRTDPAPPLPRSAHQRLMHCLDAEMRGTTKGRTNPKRTRGTAKGRSDGRSSRD